MLFSSMVFLWIFLPTVILGNFFLTIIPLKNETKRLHIKNCFLLFSSLFFYAWGGINYLFIMLSVIFINFIGGSILHKFSNEIRKKKVVLAVVVILNLAILFFFKYFNMLVVGIEAFMQKDKGLLEKMSCMLSMEGTGSLGIAYIVLPIGVSFYIFQALSYVIDVYYGKAKIQKNILDFALYVSFFPQLIAGPIVKYSDVALQIKERKEHIALFNSGIKRFCYGLGKKVIIANTFGQVADEIWALETGTLGMAVAWLGAISYTIQIYYDFSGYSDMAIGLGRMFGFEFKENFNYPYLSSSVQEFWRRWHMSLSTWFKEYVYIPLGGNRKGNMRTYFNIFIVFLLTGVWHGANFTFIVWGLMYAVLQILERLFLKRILDKNPIKLFNHMYTMLAVIIGWVYFRSETIMQANEYIVQMFSFETSNNSVLSFLSMKVLVLFVVAILCGGILQKVLGGLYRKVRSNMVIQNVDFACQICILVYSIVLIISGTYNPFIYFQF